MTGSDMFNSDLARTFQEAWETFHRALRLEPDDWSKTDWKRLVDLYRLSRITDAKKFDALSNELYSKRCVPDTRTLIEIGEWKAQSRAPMVFRSLAMGNGQRTLTGFKA
jgi:hypothetical protein